MCKSKWLSTFLLIIVMVVAVSCRPDPEEDEDVVPIPQEVATTAPVLPDRPIIEVTGTDQGSVIALPLIMRSDPRNFKFGLFDPEFPPKSKLAELESTLGTSLEVISWYQHWGKPGYSNKLRYTCELGKTPLITWEPWDGRASYEENGVMPYPLRQIAEGVFDEQIIRILRDLMSSTRQYGCEEVWIRFAHEMNTPRGHVLWYPWQGFADEYVPAWRHVVDLSRQIGFSEARWIYSPAFGNEDANLYYPGDAYVDKVGLTLNQFWNGAVDLRVNAWSWKTWVEMYEDDMEVIESFDKPIVIGETATGEGPEVDSKARWVQGMLEYAHTSDKVVAIVWFNNYTAREHPDIIFRIDSSEMSLQAFRDFFSKH